MTEGTQALIPYIPYVRRYARALTGSRQRGDEYVKACLEAIIAQDEIEGLSDNPKRALFRMFHDVWVRLAPPATSGPEGVSSEGDGQSFRRIVAALPRRERQAFLLHHLERFDVDDIVFVLRATASEVKTLIARANAELSAQPAARVLIIEDDAVIAMGNAQIIEEMGHEIVGTARTEQEAIDQFDDTRPDLILADIRLADGSSGVDAVTKIIRTSNVPVIYVTGHPEDVLTGEGIEPTYVIEKPFNPEVLKAAVAQALSFRGSAVKPSLVEVK